MLQPKNPFTPTFGSVPPLMAGRERIVADIAYGLDNGPGDPNLSTIFMGARGTGKTALLSYLSQEALAHGWISASVSAMPGMLEDILERAAEAAAEFVDDGGTARLTSLSIGGFGIKWEWRDAHEGNWRTRMNTLFRELERFDIGLVITVDEVNVELDEMLQFASTYQHFVREGKKVALFMAGLPYKVSALLREDSVSFLRRAQCHRLGRVADVDVADALAKTIGLSGRTIGPEALNLAVQAIEGFPYMLQLVGYRSWNVQPQAEEISVGAVEQGVNLARMEMRERILETTYRDLSDGDLRFCAAMLQDARESRLVDIAGRMGVSSGYVSQYKRRLLEQGVIGERGRSMVGFELPAFREFLEERLGAS